MTQTLEAPFSPGSIPPHPWKVPSLQVTARKARWGRAESSAAGLSPAVPPLLVLAVGSRGGHPLRRPAPGCAAQRGGYKQRWRGGRRRRRPPLAPAGFREEQPQGRARSSQEPARGRIKPGASKPLMGLVPARLGDRGGGVSGRASSSCCTCAKSYPWAAPPPSLPSGSEGRERESLGAKSFLRDPHRRSLPRSSPPPPARARDRPAFRSRVHTEEREALPVVQHHSRRHRCKPGRAGRVLPVHGQLAGLSAPRRGQGARGSPPRQALRRRASIPASSP